MIARIVAVLVLVLTASVSVALPAVAEEPDPSVYAEPDDVVEARVKADDLAIEQIVEGESLRDTASGAPVTVENSCCGVVWSENQQLRLDASQAGDSTTLKVQAPTSGRYDLSADLTTGPDFGALEIQIDGQPVGQPFDGYTPQTAIERRVDLGEVLLTEGEHTLSLTVTGRDPSSAGLSAGLDLLRLRKLPDQGRLTMTPRNGDHLRGLVPVFGWSTSRTDSLNLQVDGQDVVDRPALGDSATLLYEGDGIQAGPAGADFADGLEVRTQDITLFHDVSGYATDGIQIPGELLAPGANAITFKTGPDPAAGPDSNKDDFSIRNVRLLLPDGTVLRDESMAGTHYLKDSDPKKVFNIDIPPTETNPSPVAPPARGYVWDSTAVEDGEHTITLTADGPDGPTTKSATVSVDNGIPVITSTTPADGSTVKGEVTLAATAEDGNAGPPELAATLDGEPIDLGATISSDDLTDGEHVFTVTATDGAGNTSSDTATFTSMAQTPDAPELLAPEDGTTGVSTDPELRVRASDPDGDPLEVTFLQATPGTGEPELATSGSTRTDPPKTLNPDGGSNVDRSAVTTSDDVYADAAPSPDFPYQRYDIAVDRAEGVEALDVSWEGSIAADREVILSVWSLDTQAWKPVASGLGDDDADSTLVGTARLDQSLDNGVVHVLVQARDPFIDEQDLAPDGQFEDPASYDFSIAWMTDTQYLSEGEAEGKPLFGQAYREINRWIVENAEQRKIAYTAHTGDIINNWISIDNQTPEYETRARKEFQFARDTMALLVEGGMPFGITPGNHDNKFGTSNELYNEYFPPSYFDTAEDTAATGEDGQPYYGGSWREGDNQNHYDLVEAGGEDLILVYLGFIAGQDEIDWANQVLAEHPDRKAVLLTHEYLLPSYDPNGRGGELSDENARSQGQELFDEIVLPNENIFLTLSGHTHGVALNIKRDIGAQGRTVVEMLANYQFFEVDGERRTGHFRLLQFDVEESTVSVNTYSPVLDDHNAYEFDTAAGRHYTPQADEFTVPVDLSTRSTSFRTDAVVVAQRTNKVIGTASVPSGEQAAVTWTGLKNGTEYAWYARATDEFGANAESTAFSFSTVEDPCAGSDTRPTVVVGDEDSGVDNRQVDEECTTINDLIVEERDWRSHRAFVDHVREVTDDLRRERVISDRERKDIVKAANKSDVGR